MLKSRRPARGLPKKSIQLLVVTVLVAASTVVAAGSDAPEIKRRIVVKTEDGAHAFLGVHLAEETERDGGGARITEVVDDSPAEAAGLLEGDIVVEFDGDRVHGPAGVTQGIRAHEPGERVPLTVVRDGRERQLEVTLGERSGRIVVLPDFGEEGEMQWFGTGDGNHEKALADHLKHLADPELWQKIGRGAAFAGWRRPVLGVELVETTSELRSHLGGSESAGVLVGKVLPESPAQRAGIKVGDLIVSVAGNEVADVDELREALDEKEGESFAIEAVRDHKRVTVQVTIPEPEDDRPSGPRAAVGAGSWTPRSAPAPLPPRAPMMLMAPPAPPPVPPVAPPPAVAPLDRSV